MKSGLLSILVVLALGISNAYAMNKGVNISINLSFDSEPKCLIDGKKPNDNGAKGSKTYDETSISWRTGCELPFPKGISHCVLTGQGISNPDAVSQWSVFASNGKIVAQMTSEADINPDFGKLEAHYFCH
jgi:hypothetical protein